MKALDRKVLRDLRLLWSQALTIALVVASGIGGFVGCLSAVDSLALARDRFYDSGPLRRRVRHRQARARRAGAAAGRAAGRGRRAGDGRGRRARHGAGQRRPGDRPADRAGQPPAAAAEPRVSCARAACPSRARARAASSKPWCRKASPRRTGSRPARRSRRWSTASCARLRITGTALSPEYIFAGLWGMPDLRAFGVFWLDADELAAALDMQGAFNRVALKLAPDASQPAVIDAVNRQLPALRRHARARPRRPDVARHAGQRDPRAAGAGHHPAVDLPGRGRLPAARGHGAAGRHAARAGRRAQGAGLSQPRHRRCTTSSWSRPWSAAAGCWAWRWANGWACC